MMPDRPDITVVTDISANIFAVFILILIILVARGQTSVPQVPPTVIDVDDDLASVERTLLRPAALVELFYDRRTAADVTAIDLFDDRIEITIGHATQRVTAAAMHEMLHRPPASATPIGLYVFGPRWYRAVTESLAASGQAWREVSVPAALRRSDRAGQGWSPGFTELIARPLDLATFRVELAKLLASPSPADRARGAGGAVSLRGAAPAAPIPPTDLLERLAQVGRFFLHAMAVVGGLVLVAAVEQSTIRARQRSAGILR